MKVPRSAIDAAIRTSSTYLSRSAGGTAGLEKALTAAAKEALQ